MNGTGKPFQMRYSAILASRGQPVLSHSVAVRITVPHDQGFIVVFDIDEC